MIIWFDQFKNIIKLNHKFDICSPNEPCFNLKFDYFNLKYDYFNLKYDYFNLKYDYFKYINK